MKIDFTNEQTGSIIYFNGTDWVILQSADDGYILTLNSGSPRWLELNNINCIFGNGIDGDLIISSGTTTLTKDMFYNNVVISGSASIITNGFKLYCLYLDLTSAPSDAIKWNGNNGSDGSGGTGGAGGAGLISGSVGGSSAGGHGGNTDNAGSDASTISFLAGGSGGHGTGGWGGNINAGAGNISNGNYRLPYFDHNLINGVSLLNGGGSGGGGGGDHPIGGGGGGASGAGVVSIFAKTINRGSSTQSSAIQAVGGTGGNCINTSGFGGGGGGGFIYIVCNKLIGTIAVNCLDASGGDRGDTGGAGGRITIINLSQNMVSDNVGAAGTLNTGDVFKINL